MMPASVGNMLRFTLRKRLLQVHIVMVLAGLFMWLGSDNQVGFFHHFRANGVFRR
jgi:hypothetical protein